MTSMLDGVIEVLYKSKNLPLYFQCGIPSQLAPTILKTLNSGSKYYWSLKSVALITYWLKVPWLWFTNEGYGLRILWNFYFRFSISPNMKISGGIVKWHKISIPLKNFSPPSGLVDENGSECKPNGENRGHRFPATKYCLPNSGSVWSQKIAEIMQMLLTI